MGEAPNVTSIIEQLGGRPSDQIEHDMYDGAEMDPEDALLLDLDAQGELEDDRRLGRMGIAEIEAKMPGCFPDVPAEWIDVVTTAYPEACWAYAHEVHRTGRALVIAYNGTVTTRPVDLARQGGSFGPEWLTALETYKPREELVLVAYRDAPHDPASDEERENRVFVLPYTRPEETMLQSGATFDF